MARELSKGDAKKKKSGIILFARDAGVALAVVVAILVGMYAYTGLWPPLVVVESDSMMHSTDNISHIGAIDTGDLVLVKKIDGPTDVKTYMDGYQSGYKTYGDYGDVIIYRKGGSETQTPIIHRAMIYLEANPDGLSFTAPSLRYIPEGKWKPVNQGDTWDHITGSITIFGVGYSQLNVPIDLVFLLQGDIHSGFITKGDHNGAVDSMYWGPEIGYRPIDPSWVVGVARGELPWFGLLKLWATHTLNSPAPPNSVRDLWIALIIIVASPIAIDLTVSLIERRKIRNLKRKHRTEQEKTEAEDASGRAVEPPET